MHTTFPRIAAASLLALLAACDKSPQNAPAPVPVTAAPAAASAPVPTTAAAASSAAAPTAASAPTATPAAAAGTTAAPAAASDNGPEVAGSVALAQGSVTDTAKDGGVRQLKDGDDVYPGDSFVVGPDSYLDLDLEDTGRILLRPNTTFQIESYHFEPAAHPETAPTDASGQPLIKPEQSENAFFRLVKGGLRAIDGLIGHTTPQNYGVETPVATIGVRGTAFDVRYCGDDCGDEADASGTPANGLYTSVSDGTVDVKNDDGDVVTPAGHSGFVKSRKQRMQALATPPKALRHMALPEKFKARAEKNRGQIKLRRQQRRQRILERRRAAQRAKAPGKPAAAGTNKPETRQERREQRQEQKRGNAAQPAAKAARQQQREQRREEREQKQTAAPGPGTPAATGQAPAQGQEPSLRERRQQLRQERQQRRQQKQQGQPAVPAAAKPAQQPEGKQDKRDEARCKAERRREKKKAKDKDKDKCGGD